jgi:hypothetical protein
MTFSTSSLDPIQLYCDYLTKLRPTNLTTYGARIVGSRASPAIPDAGCSWNQLLSELALTRLVRLVQFTWLARARQMMRVHNPRT